jgi:protein-tyrosine kinase
LTIDDKPTTHLIERAAARLRQPAAPAPAADPAAVAARAGTPQDSWLEPKQDLPGILPGILPGDGSRPAILDDAVLARAGLIDWDSRGTRIYEEISIAQHNLLRYSFGENGAAPIRSGNIVMVTSALAGEGKSFIALNLAAAVALQAERKVLLIDGDSKPHSLGRIFGLSEAPGLLDLTKGDRDLADLVIPTAKANLEFLPLGSGAPPARARIAGLIEEIGRRDSARVIILDTAPCLSSSDPHTLASVVGQIVFVIAAGLTQQGDIEAALDLVQACPMVSLLLNKIKPWSAHAFGSYGHYSAADD